MNSIYICVVVVLVTPGILYALYFGIHNKYANIGL